MVKWCCDWGICESDFWFAVASVAGTQESGWDSTGWDRGSHDSTVLSWKGWASARCWCRCRCHVFFPGETHMSLGFRVDSPIIDEVWILLPGLLRFLVQHGRDSSETCPDEGPYSSIPVVTTQWLSMAQLLQLRNCSKFNVFHHLAIFWLVFLTFQARDLWPCRSTLNAWWTSPTAANPWGSATEFLAEKKLQGLSTQRQFYIHIYI